MDSDFRQWEPSEEQLWEALSDQVGVAKVSTLIDLAVTYLHKSEYGAALAIAEHGVDLAQAEHDEVLLARALSIRGDLHSLLESREDSARDYIEAAELFEKNDRFAGAARDFHDAAEELLRLERVEEALEVVNRGLTVAKANDQFELLGKLYLLWVQVAVREGKEGQDILELLDQARIYLRGSGEAVTLVLEVDERRALIYATLGEFDKAFEIIRNALFIAESLGFESKRAYYNYLLGKLRLSSDRAEEALSFMEKSESINKALWDVSALGSTFLEKAKVLAALGRYDEALETFDRATAHFDMTGNTEMVKECEEEKLDVSRRRTQLAL